MESDWGALTKKKMAYGEIGFVFIIHTRKREMFYGFDFETGNKLIH